MVETRVDPETGGWSVVAPGRAGRPVDRSSAPAPCPFCWGNEAMTPPEVLRVPAGAQAWQVRVVPNLYAVVDAPDGGMTRYTSTPAALPFTGRHEVVVESGHHDWDLRSGSTGEVATILFAMRERCRALAAEGPAAIAVFRNYGPAAGASLAHPHSQIVSLDQAPPGLVDRWRRVRRYHEQTGHRLHDHIASAERDSGARIVADTGEVLVFQPAAASVPHQTTLLPADPGADLAGASDAAVEAMAEMLPRVLTGLAAVLDDPAYNLVVHAGPTNDLAAHEWYRWHVTLYPRRTTIGGLEIAAGGLAINPTMPEDTAPVLRQALAAT